MTALEILGAIVAVLFSAALALFAFSYAFDSVTSWLDRIIWRAAEERIRRRASQMKNQRYWWDTPEKAAVWAACADHMADGYFPDAGIVRDTTYKRLLKEIIAERSR